MKHKRTLAFVAAIAAVLLLAGGVLAAALIGPKATEGSYYRAVIDRVNIGVAPTDFAFDPPESESAPLLLTFTVTLEKTEADFYAELLDAQIEGLDYLSLTIAQEGGAGLSKDGTLLPVNDDGTPGTLTLRFTAEFLPPAGDLSPNLSLHLLSGLSRDTADERFLDIPLSIRFE